MPTPFTHLRFAQQWLAAAHLTPEVRQALSRETPAFLLGSIAPDAQTISRQPRAATHFFAVPLKDKFPATQMLLTKYPRLARPQNLPAAHAAFMAGYLAHLALDQLWIAEIFEPVFGFRQKWGALPERLYLHNVLRAHLDASDYAQLPATFGADLRAAAPDNWLPFVREYFLCQWRDLVADQLAPGVSRTVELLARRMHTDPRVLAALLAAPDELQRRVLGRLPPEQLSRYAAEGLRRGAQCLQAYWENRPLPF